MNNKRIIQIECYSEGDFFEHLVEKVIEALPSNTPLNEAREPEWLTSKEVCQTLKISRPTLKNLRDKGELEYKKIGRNFRYRLVL